MVIETRKDCIWSNIGDLGKDLLESCGGDPPDKSPVLVGGGAGGGAGGAKGAVTGAGQEQKQKQAAVGGGAGGGGGGVGKAATAANDARWMPKIALKQRKEYKEAQVKREENLARIAAAVGFGEGVGFEANLQELAVAAKDRGYGDRAGEVFYGSYLKEMAERLEKDCADEMVKEEYSGKFFSRVVVIRVSKETSGPYHKTWFSVD